MAYQKGERIDGYAPGKDDGVAGAPSTRTGGQLGCSPIPRSIGARTPEELETLLEDALLLRERDALVALFEEMAVVVVDHGPPARGPAAISRWALETWHDDHSYLAGPRRIVQVRDIALVVTEHGVNVARRHHDGSWQYMIVVETVDATHERIEP